VLVAHDQRFARFFPIPAELRLSGSVSETCPGFAFAPPPAGDATQLAPASLFQLRELLYRNFARWHLIGSKPCISPQHRSAVSNKALEVALPPASSLSLMNPSSSPCSEYWAISDFSAAATGLF
jgi:hypothetical protein